MKYQTVKPNKVAASFAANLPLALRIHSILVPIDFSPPSKKTLKYAVAFARQFGARLILLHVVEPIGMPNFAASLPLLMEDDRLMAAATRELKDAVKAARIPHEAVDKILVRHGRAFHEIADAARTLKVNLIIMSTHGHTGLKHALVGSTTERVVRHAKCPVLVLRQS